MIAALLAFFVSGISSTHAAEERLAQTRFSPARCSGLGQTALTVSRSKMNSLINILYRFGLLRHDLDYHLIRASMVIVFLFFGYQKWFEYEAQVLIPYISNGPAR
jgi:Protein of unknown function, DUF417